MFKTTFFAACHGDGGVEFKKMDGYSEFFTASNGAILELIFHRSINYGKSTWSITERETGLSCGEYAPTRKGLLNKCTPALINRCAAALENDHCARARDDLANYILSEGAAK